MYTFKSTWNQVIEKKSEEVLDIFNYIADNFSFEVEEMNVSDDFLNNSNNKKLDLLLNNIW